MNILFALVVTVGFPVVFADNAAESVMLSLDKSFTMYVRSEYKVVRTNLASLWGIDVTQIKEIDTVSTKVIRVVLIDSVTKKASAVVSEIKAGQKFKGNSNEYTIEHVSSTSGTVAPYVPPGGTTTLTATTAATTVAATTAAATTTAVTTPAATTTAVTTPAATTTAATTAAATTAAISPSLAPTTAGGVTATAPFVYQLTFDKAYQVCTDWDNDVKNGLAKLAEIDISSFVSVGAMKPDQKTDALLVLINYDVNGKNTADEIFAKLSAKKGGSLTVCSSTTSTDLVFKDIKKYVPPAL